MVFLIKAELQPISVTNLSFIRVRLARWVWENQVEKIAGETETRIEAKTSAQSVFLSRPIKCSFYKVIHKVSRPNFSRFTIYNWQFTIRICRLKEPTNQVGLNESGSTGFGKE